jgi:hypothetical protein
MHVPKDGMSLNPVDFTPTPVRRSLRPRASPRYTGWSPKMHRQMHFATHLEYLHWLMLEGTPEVVQLCEHYPEVRLETQYYVFDMWLRWKDGHEECREVVPGYGYHGVKEFGPATSGWTVIHNWSREHGYVCERITEQAIAPQMRRIQNWRRMLPFVRFAQEHPDIELEAVVLLKLLLADLSLRELMRTQPARQGIAVSAAVAKLLHAGKISADLDHGHFGPDLLLRLGN